MFSWRVEVALGKNLPLATTNTLRKAIFYSLNYSKALENIRDYNYIYV